MAIVNRSVSNALLSFVEEPDQLLDALLEFSEEWEVESSELEELFELLGKIRNAIHDHYSTELLETFLRISENVENDNILHIRALLDCLRKKAT